MQRESEKGVCWSITGLIFNCILWIWASASAPHSYTHTHYSVWNTMVCIVDLYRWFSFRIAHGTCQIPKNLLRKLNTVKSTVHTIILPFGFCIKCESCYCCCFAAVVGFFVCVCVYGDDGRVWEVKLNQYFHHADSTM